ncbi:spore coat protein [Paenibacillus chitinolyticus]|uniref:spore coat protein n=1 Tax=Paenibacillus TaxID=44249 RepID=UPI001C48B8F3|nr:spore coat protein [Paenibacillus chitinolyticus]
MNPILEYLTGMHVMTDQVIAQDFLISAKSGIQNYAVAITETSTPEVKAVLHKHLREAVQTHERITNYMIEQGYYHPYDPVEQIKLDRQNVQATLNIPS